MKTQKKPMSQQSNKRAKSSKKVEKQLTQKTSSTAATPVTTSGKTAEEFEASLNDKIILNVREIRYDLIKNIAKKVFGWRLTRLKPDKETGSTALTHAKADWDIIWLDSDFHIDRLKGMKPYQKINHFPGMTIISLKNNLAKYLKLM